MVVTWVDARQGTSLKMAPLEVTKIPKKRKHNVTTLMQKLKICERKKGGDSVRRLAEEFEIGDQTVRDIIKKETSYRKAAGDCDKLNKKYLENKKYVSKGKYPELDECLLEWFNQQRMKSVPISANMLIHKAKWFCNDLKIDLKCSRGFVQKWQKRNGIHVRGVQGELASADFESAKEYVSIFTEENEDLSPDQIFNADETDFIGY